MIATVAEKWGSLDVLVNNAGGNAAALHGRWFNVAAAAAAAAQTCFGQQRGWDTSTL
jgi:NAD(P)-dependent dehydrogenase (short-subunit alcohol dehydrogenase family)